MVVHVLVGIMWQRCRKEAADDAFSPHDKAPTRIGVARGLVQGPEREREREWWSRDAVIAAFGVELIHRMMSVW